ncbi:facilitated trehalose transporter Tret1-like [Amphibalanus amphitrite]|uniref:facilitated trehalose transporter Tret1-like n=1 Tax=Amphibalanus amphitrite TaxID=1232801 RepID=UPI001C911D16|nr:facilitated trehalose transporter Tret1-like [Amphibalanus amphitrite]
MDGPQKKLMAEPTASDTSSDTLGSERHSIYKQILGSVVVATVTLSYSCLLGFGSILLGQLEEDDATVVVSDRQRPWLMGGAYVGSVLGCILATFLAKTFGPSRIMFWHTLPNAIGWALQALATGFWPLMAGRFVCGLACGVCVSSAQIYISEISSPRVRGVLLILPETFATAGLLMCYTLGLLLHWKMVAVVCGLVPNLVIFAGFLRLPESPTWLVSKHRLSAAAESLLFFHGRRYAADSQVQLILAGLEQTKMSVCETLRLMRHSVYLQPVLIIAVQMTILNFSGINAMFGYAVVIFRLARTGINEYHCAMVLAAVRLLCNIGSTTLIDRLGRRVLLSLSGAFCTVSLAVIGAYFYLREQDVQQVQGLHWLPLAGMICTICSYSLGIGPISWVIFGEMLPSSVRELYGSIIIIFWSLTLFTVLQVFPELTALLGNSGTFWLFAGVCAVQVLFAFCVVPETRLRTLEDIHQEHFVGKSKGEAETEGGEI